jgi:ribosomal protein S18 acetylase RimI-like enzyme
MINSNKILLVAQWSGSIFPEGASFPSLPQKEDLCRIASSSPYAPPESDTQLFLNAASHPSLPGTYYGLICAFSGAQLAGFLEVRTVHETAEIDFVAVDSIFRKQGIGSKLVETACLLAKRAHASRMLLEVGEKNAEARALYSKLGFREIGKRRKYYQGSEDALVLELNFKT